MRSPGMSHLLHQLRISRDPGRQVRRRLNQLAASLRQVLPRMEPRHAVSRMPICRIDCELPGWRVCRPDDELFRSVGTAARSTVARSDKYACRRHAREWRSCNASATPGPHQGDATRGAVALDSFAEQTLSQRFDGDVTVLALRPAPWKAWTHQLMQRLYNGLAGQATRGNMTGSMNARTPRERSNPAR